MTVSLALELRASTGAYAPFIGLGAVIVVLSALWLVTMMWGRVLEGELPAE